MRYFQSRHFETLRWITDSVCLVMSVPTSFLNFLVLFTIWRKESLQTPSNIHLFSLAISDFSMGIIGTPLTAASDLLRWFNNCYAHFFVVSVTNTLGIVSFLTIAFSSIDRLLVLQFHLRYTSFLTTRRVVGWCVFVWIYSIFTSCILNFYEEAIYYLLSGACVTFIVMIFVYFKIFTILRHHHHQIQAQLPSSQTQPSNGINLALFKKTLSNLVFIILWFILSVSPYIYSLSRINIQGYSTPLYVAKMWYASIAIICLNSLVNPFIYCWKMEDIRNGMKESLYILVAKLRGTA